MIMLAALAFMLIPLGLLALLVADGLLESRVEPMRVRDEDRG